MKQGLYCKIFFGLLMTWLLCQPKILAAQIDDNLDLEILSKDGNIVIPFALENNFVVVNVYLNNTLPLRFIVDTGAEHSIILDKGLTDYLGVNYQRKFDISGADMDSVLTAYLATDVNFRIANSLIAKKRTILVLQENYFHLERVTGTNIHGIIGGDFLGRFITEIDYRNQTLTLHDPGGFKLKRRFQRIESDFNRNRAFLHLPISVDGFTTNKRRLLLDTGASLFVLLYTAENDSTDLPQRVIPTRIASGLGGDLLGNVGRSKSVTVGDQPFGDVITYFQNLPLSRIELAKRNGYQERDGLVGNSLLKRFKLIVDYVNKAVYLKPYSNWKKPVKFDRSGLQIAVGGQDLNRFLVTDVIPGSPAAEAGLKRRDLIKVINGTPASFLSLESIFKKLEGKVGRRIKITVKRADGLHRFEFRLRDLI